MWLPSTVNANTISYTLTWNQTLNTGGPNLDTGLLEFAFLTQTGVDLTPLIPIGWSMTAIATNANSAGRAVRWSPPASSTRGFSFPRRSTAPPDGPVVFC